MSERLGPLNFGSKNDNVFLGRELVSHNTYSPETGQLIDQEIREIVERNHTKAKKVLSDNIEKLHAMADALLEYETIDAQDIDAVFAGKKVTKEILSTSGSKASESKDGSEKSEVSSGGVLPMGKAVKV
jgi:cell division protease FtsH